MNIFDSHLHLPIAETLHISFSSLVENCLKANVKGGLIIGMQGEPWKLEEVKELVGQNSDFQFAVNPNLNQSLNSLRAEVTFAKKIGAAALKIHPRNQRVNLQTKEVRNLVQLAKEMNIPVIICSFDDGSWSRIGLTKDQFIALADDFPDVNFLWAHAGGHHVLDFMFMARRVNNVFLDTSFTQSYFFKGTVIENLNYATESLSTRFMFGTDFEQAPYVESVQKLCNLYLVQNPNRESFFESNYMRFLGIHG